MLNLCTFLSTADLFLVVFCAIYKCVIVSKNSTAIKK